MEKANVLNTPLLPVTNFIGRHFLLVRFEADRQRALSRPIKPFFIATIFLGPFAKTFVL
jgi:hypothetical protein